MENISNKTTRVSFSTTSPKVSTSKNKLLTSATSAASAARKSMPLIGMHARASQTLNRKSTNSLPQQKPMGLDLSGVSHEETSTAPMIRRGKQERVMSSSVMEPGEQDSEGEIITQDHQWEGHTLAIETVERVPGKALLRATLEAQGAEEQLKQLEGDQVVGERGFFDSNYHRSRMDQLMSGKTHVTADDYRKAVAKTSPGLINARATQLKGSGIDFSLLRLGLMSYLPNGAVNLAQLEKASREGGGELVKELMNKRDEHAEGTPAYASYQMAIDELKDTSSATTAFEQRQDWMKTQMAQYLGAQASIASDQLEKLKDGDTWSIVDVRLLNPQKDEVFADSGWVHNETHELVDMAETFKLFDGEEAILDGTGPYVDHEGFVHLPVEGNGKKIKLSTQLMNVSVQGQTENTGLQKKINASAMFRLEQAHPQLKENALWKEARERLGEGESSYDVAELVVSALVEEGITTSTGCLSGKDRTGLVVGKVVARSLSKKVPEGEKKTEQIRQKLSQAVLGRNSVATRIVADMTGWRVLKVDPRAIGKGMTLRAKAQHTARLIFTWLADKFKRAKENRIEQVVTHTNPLYLDGPERRPPAS